MQNKDNNFNKNNGENIFSNYLQRFKMGAIIVSYVCMIILTGVFLEGILQYRSIFATEISVSLYAILIYIIFKLTYPKMSIRTGITQIRQNLHNFKAILACSGAGLILVVFTTLINKLFFSMIGTQVSHNQLLINKQIDLFHKYPVLLTLFVVHTCIIAPFIEEWIFRKQMIDTFTLMLGKKRHNIAMWLSVIVFAGIHTLNPILILPYLLMAGVFAITYDHFHSTFFSYITHMTFNMAGMLFIIMMTS